MPREKSRGIAVSGRHTGVDVVLRKPFDLGALRSALVEVMNIKFVEP